MLYQFDTTNFLNFILHKTESMGRRIILLQKQPTLIHLSKVFKLQSSIHSFELLGINVGLDWSTIRNKFKVNYTLKIPPNTSINPVLKPPCLNIGSAWSPGLNHWFLSSNLTICMIVRPLSPSVNNLLQTCTHPRACMVLTHASVDLF